MTVLGPPSCLQMCVGLLWPGILLGDLDLWGGGSRAAVCVVQQGTVGVVRESPTWGRFLNSLGNLL